MKGYVSRTGTRSTIEALSVADWGGMVGPLDMGGTIQGGMSHAIDNGEWPAHANGVPWNEEAFLRCIARHGPTADFIVVPDVVADRDASLARTQKWLPILLAREDLKDTPLLFAVQDGMTFADVDPYIGGRVGIFIGGSTAWKEPNIIPWGLHAEARGVHSHAGRVNTVRRINLCIAGKIKSFDGTSPVKFPSTLPMLDTARTQLSLL